MRANVLAHYLAQSLPEAVWGGQGLTFQANLFTTPLPAKPDKCVTVTEDGALVTVRGDRENYRDAYALAHRINAVLNGMVTSEVVEGAMLMAVSASHPEYVGGDEERPVFTIACSATIEL